MKSSGGCPSCLILFSKSVQLSSPRTLPACALIQHMHDNLFNLCRVQQPVAKSNGNERTIFCAMTSRSLGLALYTRLAPTARSRKMVSNSTRSVLGGAMHITSTPVESPVSTRDKCMLLTQPSEGDNLVEEEGTSRTAPGLRPASLADHVELVHNPSICHGLVQGNNQGNPPS